MLIKDIDLVPIATITSTHGLHGHCKVCSFSKQGIDGLKQYNTFFSKDGHEFVFSSIKVIPSAKNNIGIAAFNGIVSIDMIKPLIGLKLYVDRASISIDKQNEFLYMDIEDCRVYTDQDTKNHYGVVKEVKEIAGSDVLVIEKLDKKTEMLLFNSTFVEKIDINNKNIFINLPEFLSK